MDLLGFIYVCECVCAHTYLQNNIEYRGRGHEHEREWWGHSKSWGVEKELEVMWIQYLGMELPKNKN